MEEERLSLHSMKLCRWGVSQWAGLETSNSGMLLPEAVRALVTFLRRTD